ncbi:MAG: chromate transporter [Tissierellia bacterium]|nr:chromate transporter [Tissierellia bacterium]
MQVTLKEIFFTFLKINAITFGGGYTIAPVILNEFCEKRKLIKKKDMLDIIAIAQSGPGSLAISVSFLTGLKIKGKSGAIIATVAGIIPPIIIISILYFFYEKFAQNSLIQSILNIISGAVTAILLLSVYDLYKIASKDDKKFVTIMAISTFLISVIFNQISTIFIIIALIILGIVLTNIRREHVS